MKKLLLFTILITSFLIPNSFCFTQNKKIDSLLTLLKKDKQDTSKVNHLCNLSREYINIGLYDNAVHYGNAALRLAQQLNFKKGTANSYGSLGIIFRNQSDYPKALDYYLKAFKIDEELNDKSGAALYLGCIGDVYKYQGDYPKALDCHLKALRIAEESGFKQLQVNILWRIGNIYDLQKDYTRALDYYFKALKLAEDLGDKNGMDMNLGSIGTVYGELRDYPKALDYNFRALKMVQELGDKNNTTIWLGNIGGIYYLQKEYSKAIDYYFKAMEINEELGDKNAMAINIGNIGMLYFTTGKFKEAEQQFKRAIAIDNSIGALDNLSVFEDAISQLYDTTGEYKLALIHYKKAIALKDTLFSQENKKQLVRKEMNYEFDKKEMAAKAEQDIKDAVTLADKRKQQIVIWSVAVGLLLVIVFAGFIFRSLRITRKQKQIIEIQNRKTEQQKKIIEEKHKEITDSINYAERIQRSFLASSELLNENLNEHFIFFQPKDVVSGDFYWAGKLANDNFALVTADSTGHGVPGAIMSILNISSLEKAIEQGLCSPSEIFGQTRKTIIERLKKDGSTEGGKDGMDGAIICFDFANQKFTYAAANNPIWISRKNNMIELEPDKMPVGKHDKDQTPFTKNEFQLQKGDIIYTFTDGFADQFGTNGKKLMKKKFKEELVKIHQQPMAEQKKYLNQFFESWKGANDQVDDVLVIGIRV